MSTQLASSGLDRRSWGWLVLLAASSCSSAAPAITVGSPRDGAQVSATPAVEDGELGVEVPVEFAVRDFALKAPGTCKGASRCGHVHIRVDGDECNDSEATGKLPFNEEVFTSPASSNLIYCKSVTIDVAGVHGLDGSHLLTLVLVDDNEIPVDDATGRPIEASSHFIVNLMQPASAMTSAAASTSGTSTSSSSASAGGAGGQGGA
jgi:hypothetical protein